MASAMEDKAKVILADYATMRKYPGTGFHDKDPYSPQNQGEPHPADGVVVFKGPFEMSLVGGCAVKALAALKEYAKQHADELKQSRLDAEQRTLIETAVEYAAVQPSKDGVILVRNAQWNTVLKILQDSKVSVTVTGV